MADESSMEQLLLTTALEGRGPLWVKRVLGSVRAYLDMDVAFVSEFCEGSRVFRFVDAAPGHIAVEVNDQDPLDATYCQRIVDGRLPEVIRNAHDVPAARELPITARLAIVAHVGVPIRLSDGSVYGTLSCFSAREDPSLRDRDAAVLRLLAGLLGEYLETEGKKVRRRAEVTRRILRALQGDAPAMVFQPVVDLHTGHPWGYEALARFPAESGHSPGEWFSDAAGVGLGVELELAAIKAAAGCLEQIPEDALLLVKAAPATILSSRLPTALGSAPRSRVVIELTERAAIEGYEELCNVFDEYRRTGLRFAIDDTGAGYSTFRHIIWLKPEIIKLDRSLTRDTGESAANRAVTRALMLLAEGVEARVVAKGIETEAELEALQSLGIRHGQGFLLGRPGALPEPVPVVPLKGVRARRVTKARR